MLSNYSRVHVGEDGVARKCEAVDEESCPVKGVDGSAAIHGHVLPGRENMEAFAEKVNRERFVGMSLNTLTKSSSVDVNEKMPIRKKLREDDLLKDLDSDRNEFPDLYKDVHWFKNHNGTWTVDYGDAKNGQEAIVRIIDIAERNEIFTGDYGDGTIALYPIDEDGVDWEESSLCDNCNIAKRGFDYEMGDDGYYLEDGVCDNCGKEGMVVLPDY